MFTKITSFASRCFSVLMLFILLVGTLGITLAHAAGILHVAPDGIGDCSSWASACSLQTALSNAVSGEEIWVTAGTYKPTTGIDRAATFQLKEGVAVYGGFTGMETTRDQRDPAVNITILSGDLNGDDDNSNVIYNEPTRADNSYHVVTGADNATLDGFTITAGNANGDDPNCHGGGMYNVSVSSPTLTNVIFIRNSAGYAGGGMYNSISSPTLTNVIFKGNSSQAGGGMLTGTGNPTFMNVTFEQNSVSFGGAVGGGLLNSDGSPSLTNVIFRDNVSGNAAGGMLNSNGNPTLTNVIFSGNYANHYGGGMSNEYGNPILVDVTFINNVSTLGGAGMSNSSSSPILTNVTFSGNPSHRGGGMYNVNSSPTLTNVTFTGNNGDAGGGGMYEDSSASVLINVTFKGNTAGTYGGGIFSLSNNNPQIQNAIFWGNTAGLNGAQIYNNDDTSSPEVSDSLIQDGCPAGSTCKNIVTADPMLGTLGDYGGFTQTVPLLPGSSAINAGNDATCAATDQRGVTRPLGAHCDMGSYEYPYPIFEDVPFDHWANTFVERLYLSKVTGGCYNAPLSYCPEASVTRGQMAIFLLRGMYGISYSPPAASGTIFDDISSTYWAAAWIEQLQVEGITGGCGNGNYCPNAPVTREQMAIFLLRAEHGNTYTPPAATGVFADVPADYWAASWIEQLAAEGITGGCGGDNYCPRTVVNRAQMSVFLVAAFNLP